MTNHFNQPIEGHPGFTYGFRTALIRKSQAGQRKPIKNYLKLWLFFGLVKRLRLRKIAFQLLSHIYLPNGHLRSCKVCGCTWYQACPGGCAWADAEMSVCTGCVPPKDGWSELVNFF